ncbi:uncharacterized protein L3040_006335 [Drepanopeziza brunnea f. sp. 'multigermtubi']|uniref:uncharacterized protein n=1 Tax=Drepanopeziza brunnea f. sp. 'multigermtubi' TaxID=698441 RepID=UPI0023966356|nr:hypothetical protein L3040_006335 [Drepanopeziza brunnea f. sp. 'multigermtubi']
MNNEQFRKLVQNTPARQPSSSSPSDKAASRNGATPSALGSRMRSSIPMTPRTVAGYNPGNAFARQLAERNASSSLPSKKFRSAAAPKGVKLADGYTDRAQQLRSTGSDDDEENEKVTRVKALEEMMKLQQIDEATFIKLREEILGDDVKDRAKLVKGLDWGLLERVKRGEVGVEDVLEGGLGAKAAEAAEEEGEEEDLDGEFERLEEREVEAVVKEKEKKKGEMAPPALTGKKRTRDQILAEMKAARQAAKEAAAPSLGAKFKKVGVRRPESRIERDGKGREVLITVDEHGNEKRKVRRVVEEPVVEKGHGLLMPDKDAKPLGMEVPEIPKVVEEEEDINIFDDVDDEYDPLAGLGDDTSEDEPDPENEDGEISDEDEAKTKDKAISESAPGSMAPPPRPAASRNYFNTPSVSASSLSSSSSSKPPALTDPTLLAALRKASSLNLPTTEPTSTEEAAKEARRKKMLQRDDRDAEDMDIGFGSSRFADEEDFEEKKIKLSEWGGQGGKSDDDETGGSKGGAKRKRGAKKRKGDVNSAADVMKVLERRKGEKS